MATDITTFQRKDIQLVSLSRIAQISMDSKAFSYSTKAQEPIILFGFYIICFTVCVCVVYGAVSLSKPGLLRGLKLVKSSSETIRDNCRKQLVHVA